jgi:hypothetical protein
MDRLYGVDFDGTICDTASMKRDYILRETGASIQQWEANRTSLTRDLRLLSDAEYDRMLGFICSREGTMPAKPLPGAIQALEALSRVGSVYVITGRRGLWLSAAVEWMDENGADAHVEGYVSSRLRSRSKLEICGRMGVSHMVEDDPGILEGECCGLVKVLLGRGSSPDAPDNGLVHAGSWAEAMRHLV